MLFMTGERHVASEQQMESYLHSNVPNTFPGERFALKPTRTPGVVEDDQLGRTELPFRVVFRSVSLRLELDSVFGRFLDV